MMYEWREKKCKNCTCWMLDFKSKLLHYLPDKDYPAHIDPSSIIDGKLTPKQISYDLLKEAITLITNELLEDNISQNQCKSYLKQFGLNLDAQEQIIENSLNMKQWKECNKNKHVDPETFRTINDERKDNPKKFKQYQLPSSWYHTTNDISVFVDVPMHLLMLGVVKTVMLAIGNWLRSLNKNTIFKNAVTGLLSEIKALNLEWCKILEYPKTEKTGGWVSENFAAMARLGGWFYSMIHLLFPDEEYIQPDSIDHNKWGRYHLEKWFTRRGLTAKGKIGELKKQITSYVTTNTIPPLVMDTQVQPISIIRLVGSMCLMIKTIMSSNPTAHDADKLEALTRFFLINYDNVTCGRTKKDSPPWITHYNMLCLLNLPDVLRKYGSMRNVWEGGMDGESYVKRVKNKLKAGLVYQWQVWAIDSLLKEELYSEWRDDTKESNNLEEHKMKMRQLCKVYGSYKEARKAYDSGKPFSCMQIHETICLCYREKGEIVGKTMFVGRLLHQLNTIEYYQVTLKKKKTVFDLKESPADMVYSGVLFLPLLTKTGYPDKRDENSSYCLIKSDWS